MFSQNGNINSISLWKRHRFYILLPFLVQKFFEEKNYIFLTYEFLRQRRRMLGQKKLDTLLANIFLKAQNFSKYQMLFYEPVCQSLDMRPQKL